MFKIIKSILKFLTFILVSSIIVLWIYPIKIDVLNSHPRPSKSFEESLQRIETLKNKAPADLHSAGQTIIMHHGQKTEKVVVFLHGFTNSPRQFKDLAELFYQKGFNVFIPRMPYHGLKESHSSKLQNLTAEDLVAISDEAVDIAQGLGDHVTVVGLSMGGVMAGWIAQNRSDVERAVLIAPNFGTFKISNIFLKPSINFLLAQPNHFVWWNKKMKMDFPRPETAYYGFYSRALGHIRRLGWCVQIRAQEIQPKTKSILFISNANDHAVRKQGRDAILIKWSKYPSIQMESYEFPKELNLEHDLIDPQQPRQNTMIVYPKLLELINKD